MVNKINIRSLIIVFFFIPCITPAAFLEGGYLKLFFNSWRVVAFLIMPFYMLRKGQKITNILFWDIVFSMLLCVSTWIQKGNFKSSVSIAMMMFTIIALSEIEIQSNVKHYFKVIAAVSKIILIVDVFQIFSGIGFISDSNATLLGMDNFAIFTVLPMMGIIIINDYINLGFLPVFDVILILLAVLAKFKTFAVTSMLACISWIMFVYIFTHIDTSKRVQILLWTLAFTGVIMISANFTTAYLGFAHLFGKEPKIEHSRITIWLLSIKAILRKPIFGYGVLSEYEETIAIAGTNWRTCSHTHNYILELLFRGGIIGTFCYLCMFKDFFKIVLRVIEKYNYIGGIVRATLFAILVLWVTDSYYAQAPVYVFVVLCSHIDLLPNVIRRGKRIKLV